VFFVRGQCKEGENCTYSHDFEIKLCNYFVRTGRCTSGNRCTFQHNKEERAKFLAEKKILMAEKNEKEAKGGDMDNENENEETSKLEG
jgi:hypothetical protein